MARKKSINDDLGGCDFEAKIIGVFGKHGSRYPLQSFCFKEKQKGFTLQTKFTELRWK